MVHLIPTGKLPSAKETTVLLQHVRLHGFPVDIISDKGPQFISQFWKAFCSLVGATVSLSSGYHPQSNGQTERFNQELENGLHCLVAQAAAQWSKNLLWVEYTHNSLPSVSTGYSPFECVYRYQPPLFQVLERGVGVLSLIQMCPRTWARVRRTLLHTSASYKAMADCQRNRGPSFQLGQRVWLSTRDLPLRSECRKLAPRFIGPLPVSKTTNPVGLKLPSSMRIHPTFHISKVKPLVESPLVTFWTLTSFGTTTTSILTSQGPRRVGTTASLSPSY